jgi:hypothetical protein
MWRGEKSGRCRGRSGAWGAQGVRRGKKGRGRGRGGRGGLVRGFMLEDFELEGKGRMCYEYDFS